MWASILSEWASLIFRWLHVIAAVGWIGSSFYFIHLDLELKPRSGLPEGAHGEAWQVHGGGFYHIIKFLVAPSQMPSARRARQLLRASPAWPTRAIRGRGRADRARASKGRAPSC